MKLSDRYSPESLAKSSLPDKTGRLFMNHHAMMDLSNVEVVGASVDTIRQLYFGIPKPYLIESFQQEIEQKEQFFHLSMPDENDRFHTEPFHLAKMGKVARYRYKSKYLRQSRRLVNVNRSKRVKMCAT